MAGSGIFLGAVSGRVDGKSRIVLPANLRKEIPLKAEGRIYIAQHDSLPCLIGAGADFAERFDDYLNDLAQAARDMGRPFDRSVASLRMQTGFFVPVDTSGRFVIPPVSAKLGQTKGGLIFLGRNKAFEIWSLDVLMAGEGPDFAARQSIARAVIEADAEEAQRKKGGAE